uniref:WD repeat-containing protein 55 n=1 Tax=Noccaea caerulescens TaxID=107243 RepID=A0A1J3F7T6_NOCCA
MEIDLGANSFGIDFHPSKNLVAAGLIDGHLHFYRYETDSSSIVRERKFRAHKESCRAVRFIDDGQRIVTASADCSIRATDVETGASVAHLENAHEDAVNTLMTVTETTIASGDDKGCVKVWDTRQRSCSHEFNVHEDYISDMTFQSSSMKLVATSGDGTLSVCNLRTNKVQSHSEFSEDELLSVVIMKNGRKVICGTQDGTLMLYSWGFFKDCSDRFIDHAPNSVDTLLKLDEDRVISGCDNGILSLVGILPNRIIQPIGSHEFPIEDLALSHDRRFLGSTAHDNMLKLWDLETILEGSNENLGNASGAAGGSDDDEEEMDLDDSPPKPSKGTNRKTKSKPNRVDTETSFFADL